VTTITDYYKYSLLAAAAYVRIANTSATGANFSTLAASDGQQRLPLTLGQYLFDANVTQYGSRDTWNILHYFRNDRTSDSIAAQDKSGLGAILFQQGSAGETVLAITGTESNNWKEITTDFISADLGQIGILGLALTQVIAAVNLIERMRAAQGANVEQIRLQASLTRPASGEYLEVFGAPGMFISFSREMLANGGSGELSNGRQITVTGHSLGGNVAYALSRLYPDLIKPDVYLYNSAGYDPVAADFLVPATLAVFPLIKAFLANEFGLATAGILPVANQLTNPALDLIVKALRNGDTRQGTPTVINLRSESIVPGDDVDIVASALTGANRYPTAIEFPMESNNHVIEPSMDALALLATLYSMNNALTMAQLTRLFEAGSAQLARSEEGLTEALFRLLVPEGASPGNSLPLLPTSDAISITGTGKGELSARNAFYDAILRMRAVIKGKPELLLLPLTEASVSDLIAFAQDPDAIAMHLIQKGTGVEFFSQKDACIDLS